MHQGNARKGAPNESQKLFLALKILLPQIIRNKDNYYHKDSHLYLHAHKGARRDLKIF